MKTFVCTYSKYKSAGLTQDHRKTIEAENAKDAYKKFLDLVGVYPLSVMVSDPSTKYVVGHFSDHIDSPEAKKNANFIQPNIGAKTPDSDIEYQESGWATFLNICGVLNLILFVIGGIWLLNASSSEQFIAMNLTIIGLVATINSFFFAFLVNTFTRIQHNTHLTQINTHQITLELKKLNNKTESKD